MKKILYIEDNEDDRDAAYRVFKNSGIYVKCLDDAIKAFSELENNSYDLVVCDMMMPIYDGLKFAKQMSKMGIEIPLVLASGVEALESFDTYSGLRNYLGFLLKPLNPANIARFLR